MKVAVCLSGQPRALPDGLESLRKNLLEPNGIKDVFIHAWKSPSFSSAQPHQSGRWSYHPDTEKILASLSPKSVLIQENHDFKELSHLQDLPTAIQRRLASMFYSVKAANALKKEQEALTGKYDFVIKTRVDINYHREIVLDYSSFLDGHIQVPRLYQSTRVNDSYPCRDGGSYSSLADTFMIGTSEQMDTVSGLSGQFEQIYNQIWPFAYGEAFLGYWVRGVNRIPIQMIDVDYNLIR